MQLPELIRALREREAEDEIIRAGDDIATRASLDREREMVETSGTDGIGKHDRMGKEPKEFQLSGKLNAEQSASSISFSIHDDFAVNIEGAAGTGKTKTLKRAWARVAGGGRLMAAVAPTLSAVEELKKAGFQNAMTIERLLQNKDSASPPSWPRHRRR